MPVTYGFAGWFTNMVALKMTFYPLKFIGIKPFFGWQGIVPRKATGLALKSVQMLQEKLINVGDFLEKIDMHTVAESFKPALKETIPDAIDHMTDALSPELRRHISDDDRRRISERALSETSSHIDEITAKAREDSDKAFSLKNLVLKKLTGENVHLIVDMFQSIGSKEFTFIRRSGWYFGGLLGIIQAVIWIYLPYWWTLPLQGLLVGYITNYLALTMIFRPLHPRRILGVTYQGLFLKRQHDVAGKYAALFAGNVLTPKNVMEEILYRRTARTVLETVETELADAVIDSVKQADEEKLRSEILQQTGTAMREAQTELIGLLSEASGRIEKVMQRGMNVEKNIKSRMQKLPPEEFEPILRTAFQQDEYILILLGSVLGAAVGFGQALYMVLT